MTKTPAKKTTARRTRLEPDPVSKFVISPRRPGIPDFTILPRRQGVPEILVATRRRDGEPDGIEQDG